MDARGNLILVVVVIVLLPEGDWLRDWWNDFVGTAIVQNRSTSMGFFM